MAAQPSSLAYKHWQRIIRLWPTDLLRPQTVSFQHVMQQRLSKVIDHHPSSPGAAARTSTRSNHDAFDSTGVATPSPRPAAWDEAQQMRQVNALYSLLENRYLNETPMPQSLRKPATNPEHYDMVVRELEEAPHRTWFGALLKRVKGSLRFS